MKFAKFSLFFLLLIPAACTEGGIPPASIGGDGAKLMDGNARNAVELYDMAYSWLSKHHLNVRYNLRKSPPNYYGAAKNVDRIIVNLKIMKSLTIAPTSEQIGDYIAKYQVALEGLDRKSGGTGILRNLNGYEKQVKIWFATSQVKIRTQIPVKPEDPGETKKDDPDKLPAPKDEEPVVKPEPKDEPKTEPRDKVTTEFFVLYKAWEAVHQDLVGAYNDQKECVKHYQRVVKIVRDMAAASKKAEDKATLGTCAKMYDAVNKKTKGFTFIPDKLKREDIHAELRVISRLIDGEFNPDGE